MNIYVSIFVMAAVTYIIRIIPLIIFRKPITNKFFRSFLYYAPYVTLSVLAFPAVLSCTGNVITSVAGFFSIILLSLLTGNFIITSFASCLFVFILQLFV